MIKNIIIVGGKGSIGLELTDIIRKRNLNPIMFSALEICKVPEKKLPVYIEQKLKTEGILDDLKNKKLGLVLAHRVREENIVSAISCELAITRNFSLCLKNFCKELRVVIISSITGQFVNLHNNESYHYCKDLQKSINRYFASEKKIKSNILELSFFQKYKQENADKKYIKQMQLGQKRIEGRKVINSTDIGNFCLTLIEASSPPVSSLITYDNGYSLRQI